MSNDGDGRRDARVQVLTAEVRTLVVGSRQVTLSVYSQLDEVEFEQIEPFGRVRPKNGDDYIWLVGRHRADGALVRAKIPAPGEAMAREVGFSDLEYSAMGREADTADAKAARYEASPDLYFSHGNGEGRLTGREAAAICRNRAKELRGKMGRMFDKYIEDREPWQVRAEDAEELPLIVLAGLR